MSNILVENTELEITVEVAPPSAPEVIVSLPVISIPSLPEPPDILVENTELGISVVIASPPTLAVTVSQPLIVATIEGAELLVTPSTVPGPPGPQGLRGASFIGDYQSEILLPPYDGVNVLNGDFAVINSDGTLWRVQ